MKLQFECREEQCPAIIEYRPTGQREESLSCPRCERQYEIHRADQLARGEALTTCAMCGGHELFVRKDFPQKTGLVIVAVAAAISFASLKSNPGVAYGVLAAAVAIDVIIYYLIGVVTACYRCRTEYWGVRRNEEHAWFDLATSEKYL